MWQKVYQKEMVQDKEAEPIKAEADVLPLKKQEKEGNNMDVKETKELILGVGIIAESVISATKDGFQGKDVISIGTDVARNFSVIKEGFAGVGKIKAEIQDLTGEEAKELLNLLVDTVIKVKSD